MPTVLVLNGPNLNLLGTREPDHYGSRTLADVARLCDKVGADLGVDVDFRQSNHEGDLIDWIHEAGEGGLGVVLNAGGYTHTSVALQDAIKGVPVPVVELHISNIHARESFRRHSVLSPAASGVVMGFGVGGYECALRALVGAERANRA